MTDGESTARGYVTRAELDAVRLQIELMKQARDLVAQEGERAEKRQQQANREDVEMRRERQKAVDGAFAAVNERLAHIEVELTSLIREVKPLLDAFEGQQIASREFNRALRIALVVTLGSLFIISILGPLLSRIIFGAH